LSYWPESSSAVYGRCFLILVTLSFLNPSWSLSSRNNATRPNPTRFCVYPPDQAMIFDTTPAPTVRPPSRMAKRRPSSMAMGLISSAESLTLSPGMTISTPSGNWHWPVTSVVRK